MQLTLVEQAAALIGDGRRPVIIIPPHPSLDAVAGAVALRAVLKKLGHAAQVVCPSLGVPPAVISGTDSIQSQLGNIRSLIVDVELNGAALDSLSYETTNGHLRIFIAPKTGTLRPDRVKPAAGDFSYDGIIAIGLASPDQLGAMFSDHPEFFSHVPILNIDCHPANTRFGQVVMVDTIAMSVGELVYSVIRQLGAELLDEPAATNLLAGIMDATRLFRHPAVTPRVLGIASHLMAIGARRDDIIRHLHQTKTLPALKLWGRALTKMQSSDHGAVVWSSLTQSDVKAAGAGPHDTAGLIEEFISATPDARYACLFVEGLNGIEVSVSIHPQAPLPRLPTTIRPVNSHRFQGTMTGTLAAAEDTILSALRHAAGA